MKKIVLGILLCAGIGILQSQNDVDAFRFSQIQQRLGTARFMGAGGAFGAIGADYSAILVNPGAIGVYKQDEISLTPLAISALNSYSQYMGETSRDQRVRYCLPQVGGVFAFKTPETSDMKYIQFAFGCNRIQDFNQSFRINGKSPLTSLQSEYLSALNGNTPDYWYSNNLSPFEANALFLYDHYWLDTVPGTSMHQYFSYMDSVPTQQAGHVITKGNITEIDFSLGGNYNDKLFFGVSVGIPVLDYSAQISYSETDIDNELTIDSYAHDEWLEVKGTGLNLKAGVIYRPVSFLRLGLSLHTPTYYLSLTDKSSRSVSLYRDADSPDENGFTEYHNNEGSEEVVNLFKYRLTTPMRAIGSVGFLIAKRAFIDVDYEWADYNTMFLNSTSYQFSMENKNIDEKYRSTHTIRVGGEVFVSKSVVLRAGYNVTTSAFKKSVDNNSLYQQASAGIGFRSKSFFFDLAYSFAWYKDNYWMYSTQLQPVENQFTAQRVIASVGFKF
ncbi:MAG: hypothetical protein LBR51_05820 [Bacteroidales bacterium]|jgi:hypothetical protein|nr:hypothetical protein [Bacteroidales bacterium]